MKKRLLPLLFLSGPIHAQEDTRPAAPEIQLPGSSLVSGLPSSNPGSTQPVELGQYAPFPAEGVYWIQEGGRTKQKFVLSRDEIAVGSKGACLCRNYGPAADGISALEMAEELALTTGEKTWPVLYPAGLPANPDTRRLMSDRIHVVLEPGVDSTLLGSQLGAHTTEQFEFAPDDYFFRFDDAVSALRAAGQLIGHPGVLYIEPCLTRKYNTHALPKPSDGFFDGDYPGTKVKYTGHISNRNKDAYQWYLENTGLNYTATDPYSWYGFTADPALDFALIPTRVDIRARPAWEYNRGEGTRISILDSALNMGHPDLSHAKDFNASLFYDYIDDDDDPLPKTAAPANVWFGQNDWHATSMAGIMFAKHGNGVTSPANSPRELAGVSPEAKFIMQRVDGQVDEVDMAKAIWKGATVTQQLPSPVQSGITYTKLTYTNTPSFDVLSYALSAGGSAPQPLFSGRIIMETFRKVVGSSRNKKTGKGAIMVTAGYNNGNFHGNQNWSELRASGLTLVVGGVSDSGRRIAYSSRGANLAVVAPAAGTEDSVADEVFPNLEPRIDPVTTTPWPRTFPPFIEYPANPSAPMPFTVANLPAAQIDYQWNAGHTQQLRRAAQTIVTLNAEQTPGYQRNFEGNSASAAMVGGVASLIAAEQPLLSWLDIHEIIMRSAEVNQAPLWWDAYTDEVEQDWRASPTGKPFSHKYGFGVVNATRAMEWAKCWIPLGAPKIKSGATLKSFPVLETSPRYVVHPTNGGMLVWDEPLRELTSRSMQNSNVPHDLKPLPTGFRIQKIFLTVNAPSTPLVNNGRTVQRAGMGMRLIAPPERDATADQPASPTIISNLMYPCQEDSGAGLDFWTFSTNHHLGAIHSTNRNLLLHVYGAGANDRFGTTDGVSVKYLGTEERNPVNQAPGFVGNRAVGEIRAPIGRALRQNERGLVYQQAAPVGAPPKWVSGGRIKIWYGGRVPADAINPADPDTPGQRRIRSPHVMKPFPLPVVAITIPQVTLDDDSYPAPLDVPGAAGYVPLAEPRWRTRELGQPAGAWQAGMPPGIVFNPETGIFSGVPTQIGRFQVELTATNVFDFAPAPTVMDPDTLNHLLISPGRKLLINVDFHDPADFQTYEEWSSSYFPNVTPSVARDGDEDEDGYTNYFEYIAGSLPNFVDDASLQIDSTPYYVVTDTSTSPPTIRIHWTQNFQSQRQFFVETSTDLTNWVPLDRPVPISLDYADAYDYTHPVVAGERRYFRIKDRIP